MEHMIKNKCKRAALLCLLVLSIMAFSAQTAFAAPVNNPLTLTVHQTFTNDGTWTAVPKVFSYQMTAKTPGAPMPSGVAGDSYSFGIDGTASYASNPITFPQTAGSYVYEIAQEVPFPPAAGYTYDDEVYTVTVYVDYGGNADIVIAKSNHEKVQEIRFENRWAPKPTDPALMVDPPVKKTVMGSPKRKGNFTFKLQAGDKTNPMPAGSRDGVKLIGITGPGQKEFGTWSYTKAGTYYYTVSELDNGITRYAYDTQVYTITDTVTENTSHELILNRTVTNAANSFVDNFTFINEYSITRREKENKNVGQGPDGGAGIDGPNTGDDTNASALLLTMALAALTAVCCAVYLLRFHKRRAENCAAQ